MQHPMWWIPIYIANDGLALSKNWARRRQSTDSVSTCTRGRSLLSWDTTGLARLQPCEYSVCVGVCNASCECVHVWVLWVCVCKHTLVDKSKMDIFFTLVIIGFEFHLLIIRFESNWRLMNDPFFMSRVVCFFLFKIPRLKDTQTYMQGHPKQLISSYESIKFF